MGEISSDWWTSEGMSNVPLCSAYVTKSHLQHCQPKKGAKKIRNFEPTEVLLSNICP